MASRDELACTYAALILADDDLAVTGEKLATILKSAGVNVEPFWPPLYAKALAGINIKDLISNIGSASAAPAAAAATAGGDGGAGGASKEEKKEEKEEEEEEEDDDMGFGLFD